MRLKHLVIGLTILSGILVYAAGPGTKASPPAPAGADGMVLVPVSVLDAKKQPLPGLKAENFQLLEDGKEQKVDYFSAAGDPVNVGVVLALSERGPVKTPGQNDRISVDINNAAARIREANGPNMPALFDTMPFDSDGVFNVVAKAVDNLSKQSSSRKALVVVSDGLISNGTQASNLPTPKNLIETVKQAGFPIYFVYVVSSLPEPALTEGTTTGVGYYLQQFSDLSGGSMVIGQVDNSLAKSSTDLRDALKNLYFLGFKSTNAAKDGKSRKLTVKVTPPGGAKVSVNVKGKYFAAKE